VVIQHLAKLFGAAVIIPGELDGPVAHLAHRGYRAGQVALTVGAHRVKLQADGRSSSGLFGLLSALLLVPCRSMCTRAQQRYCGDTFR
jgi:hypothetical protein